MNPPMPLIHTCVFASPLQDEMIAYVRRKSAAFSRGRSKYRGVSGQAGRWEARIGAYCGRKNVSIHVMAGKMAERM